MQRGNARGFHQRQLLGKPLVLRLRGGSLLQRFADALSHLRRGGLGECHHQNAVERNRIRLVAHPRKAALNQCAGLARPCSGHDEDVAIRHDRALLIRGRLVHGAAESDFFKVRYTCVHGSMRQTAR